MKESELQQRALELDNNGKEGDRMLDRMIRMRQAGQTPEDFAVWRAVWREGAAARVLA